MPSVGGLKYNFPDYVFISLVLHYCAHLQLLDDLQRERSQREQQDESLRQLLLTESERRESLLVDANNELQETVDKLRQVLRSETDRRQHAETEVLLLLLDNVFFLFCWHYFLPGTCASVKVLYFILEVYWKGNGIGLFNIYPPSQLQTNGTDTVLFPDLTPTC